MDTHWSKFKIGAAVGKVARVAAATSLLVLTFGPMPFQSATTVSAAPKELEWGDQRPPLTTLADSADADGFTHLPGYDNALHAITVASNGDIFTAGSGLDINVGGAATCGDVTVDYDGNANGTCQITVATTKAHIYKSVDGGKSWRAALMAGVTDGTTVQQIVVSPDYPSDTWVAAVFSTLAAGDVATALNGICWSTDGALTFAAANCAAGSNAGTDADLDDTLWRTAAVSPDFNWNDSNGELAMGGTWVAGAACSVVATTTALKTALAATTFTDLAETTITACDAATDTTISLAYTSDEEPIVLARLHVLNGAQTFGQVKTAAAWPATADSGTDELSDDNTTDMVATQGKIAFDDEYSTGGSFYAGAGGAAGIGGVFYFSGTSWTEKTLGDVGCDVAVSDLAVSGNSSTAKLVASLALSNVVCRSSNAGSSWSDTDADGGDSVCDACIVTATTALTRIAVRRSDAATVYWTSSGNLGGVFKSTSSGSSWADTGLTNQAYIGGSVEEIDGNIVFVTATDGAGLDAVFWSNDYGTGATYKRVVRYDSTDLNVVGFSSDFPTLGIGYIYRAAATTDVIIKTTDGGNTWDTAASDPFENSPETNELVGTSSQRTGTTVFLGGSKGHVSSTTDGGGTWTLLAKDFGDRIDEFDFSDATTYFTTALDTDTTLKIWQTRDGGATFTQVGNTPWGTGDGTITTVITGYKAADNTGTIHASTSGATTTDDLWRLKIGDATFSEFESTDVAWSSFLSTTTGVSGVGDGQMILLWDATADELYISVYPNTGDLNEYDPDNAADAERDNLLLVAPNPPVTTGTIGTTKSATAGYHIQSTTGGRIMEMTFNTSFLGGAKLVSPVNNSSVPTNIGDNGVPQILRWDSVTGADTYDVMMGLNPALTDGAIIATPTTNLLTVTAAIFPLVQGNSYYWKARVATAEGAAFEGPWSAINSFSVASQGAPQSPQPSLPSDGALLPGLSTQISWNNPAGVTQVQVQVTPLNGDGPQINLIIGSAITSYDVPAPLFGTGPYVMLPGAGYTWRVRTTNATTSVGENDASWGPWSTPRTFTTAAPNSGTIQLLAPINGAASADTTPTVQWKDSNSAMFYYEVQVSSDPNFGESGVVAPVYWNLIHGGQTTPANSWTVPDAFALKAGTYYWRVRQRLQATPKGAGETGIAWSPAQSFVVS